MFEELFRRRIGELIGGVSGRESILFSMPMPSAEMEFIMKKLAFIAVAIAVAVSLMVVVAVCGCTAQGGDDAEEAARSSVPSGLSEPSGSNVLSGSSAPSRSSAQSAGSQGASASASVKNYTIERVDAGPNWDDIDQLDIDDAAWTDSFGIMAHAQLSYDQQAIYVHMWAEEQDVRATYSKDDLLANCYEDSCLEFFVAPVADDERYLNFELNPNGAICNEIGAQKQGRIRLIAANDAFEVSSSRTDDGWEVFYQIPFDYIRTLYPSFEPQAGMQMKGNFYKCGNLTANKHYLAWNHVDSDTPNFHVPGSFGVLVFG